ncbi:MAG: FAD-binding oxidoreductase [Candidatus Schekmanbacteria bacterium]|nr:FAD-binding oxidoreductase [Candidatus Schekmanbacteria bacterium]
MTNPIPQLQSHLPMLRLDESLPIRETFRTDANGFAGALPLAVAYPQGAGDVQALVRAARALHLSLVPVSSSGAHHRGDTTCADNTIVVDLSSLQRVLRIDRRNRVSLFQAGVTFSQLAPALRNHGLRALLPLCPRPGKSALAAYLEREPTIYPRFQWDISDPLLCTEVVFGTGEYFRTGAAAGPGTLEDQWAAGDAQKSPLGPGQSDLMRIVQGAQGSVGIVTWCSAKAERLPEWETLHLTAAESLAPLVRAVRMLLRRGFADIAFVVNGPALAALCETEREDVAIAAGRTRPWYLVYSLGAARYFPEDKRRYVHREIDELYAQTGLQPAHPPVGSEEALLRRLTCPEQYSTAPYWKHAGEMHARELFFQTTLDRTPRFHALVAAAATAPGAPERSPLVYVQPQVAGRCCHFEVIVPHAAGERERVEAWTQGLAHQLSGAGAFFSRPYGPWSEIAFARCSTAWVVPKVKAMFDPDAVLAPGRLDVSRALALNAVE